MSSAKTPICEGCDEPIRDGHTPVYADGGAVYHKSCDSNDIHCEADYRETNYPDEEIARVLISERMLAELNEHGKTSSAGQSGSDGLLVLEVVDDE